MTKKSITFPKVDASGAMDGVGVFDELGPPNTYLEAQKFREEAWTEMASGTRQTRTTSTRRGCG